MKKTYTQVPIGTKKKVIHKKKEKKTSFFLHNTGTISTGWWSSLCDLNSENCWIVVFANEKKIFYQDPENFFFRSLLSLYIYNNNHYYRIQHANESSWHSYRTYHHHLKIISDINLSWFFKFFFALKNLNRSIQKPNFIFYKILYNCFVLLFLICLTGGNILLEHKKNKTNRKSIIWIDFLFFFVNNNFF